MMYKKGEIIPKSVLRILCEDGSEVQFTAGADIDLSVNWSTGVMIARPIFALNEGESLLRVGDFEKGLRVDPSLELNFLPIGHSHAALKGGAA